MYKKIGLILIVLSVLAGCSSSKKTAKTTSSAISNHLTDAEEQQFYYYYYEALKLRDNKKYDQALETFLLCYNIDSLNPGLNSDLGLFYKSIGFNGEAVKHLETSVRLQPENWWYNLRLINYLTEQKNFDRAIKLTLDLQKKYPYKEDVYYMLATLYGNAGKLDKAISAYDQMEKFVGINEALSFEKFKLYIQSGKAKKGIGEIEKLIDEFPNESRYRVLRGDIYMDQQPDKALAIYEDVLAKDPQNPNVYLSLSEYYNAKEQPDKALGYIVTALKNEQLDMDIKMGILGKYVESLVANEKKIDETEELFKLLVDRYPLEEQIHLYYATFLEFQNREADVMSELETILNINSKNQAAWLKMIQIHFSAKDYDKMIETASRAIESLPEDPAMYFYKSLAQAQKKEYEPALQTTLALLPLLEKSPNPAFKSDVLSHLADVYYNLERKEEAFETFENALKANANNHYTMNNYAYYLSLEKENLKRAERLSAKTVELEPKNSTFLDTYAWILYQQGSYSLAKIYIERAVEYLEQDHEPGVVLDHCGDIYWKNGDKEKAVEMWQKAFDSGLETDELKQKLETKSLTEEVTP